MKDLPGRADSNGSYARGELRALADTLLVGGDCSNKVASNNVLSIKETILTLIKALHNINESIDEPQSFDTIVLLLFPPSRVLMAILQVEASILTSRKGRRLAMFIAT
jgi:hypothetical protein